MSGSFSAAKHNKKQLPRDDGEVSKALEHSKGMHLNILNTWHFLATASRPQLSDFLVFARFCCMEQQISELRALIDARPRLDACGAQARLVLYGVWVLRFFQA